MNTTVEIITWIALHDGVVKVTQGSAYGPDGSPIPIDKEVRVKEGYKIIGVEIKVEPVS